MVFFFILYVPNIRFIVINLKKKILYTTQNRKNKTIKYLSSQSTLFPLHLLSLSTSFYFYSFYFSMLSKLPSLFLINFVTAFTIIIKVHIEGLNPWKSHQYLDSSILHQSPIKIFVSASHKQSSIVLVSIIHFLVTALINSY